MPPRISVFPKCYFDLLVSGEMDYPSWIRDAVTLGGEGVEHYDGFFRSYAEADVAHLFDDGLREDANGFIVLGDQDDGHEAGPVCLKLPS